MICILTFFRTIEIKVVKQYQKIKQVKNIVSIVILALVVFSSCDHEYGYTYKVLNNSDSEVKFDLLTDWIDSTNLIDEGETSILFIVNHGFEGPDGPSFADVSMDLDSIFVTRKDTVFSIKDYLASASWEYNNGVYKVTITNTEFE